MVLPCQNRQATASSGGSSLAGRPVLEVALALQSPEAPTIQPVAAAAAAAAIAADALRQAALHSLAVLQGGIPVAVLAVARADGVCETPVVWADGRCGTRALAAYYCLASDAACCHLLAVGPLVQVALAAYCHGAGPAGPTLVVALAACCRFPMAAGRVVLMPTWQAPLHARARSLPPPGLPAAAPLWLQLQMAVLKLLPVLAATWSSSWRWQEPAKTSAEAWQAAQQQDLGSAFVAAAPRTPRTVALAALVPLVICAWLQHARRPLWQALEAPLALHHSLSQSPLQFPA